MRPNYPRLRHYRLSRDSDLVVINSIIDLGLGFMIMMNGNGVCDDDGDVDHCDIDGD